MYDYNIIDPEILSFDVAQGRVEEAIDQQRAYLQKRVEKGNISDAYLNHMNRFHQIIIDYINETESLLKAISALHATHEQQLEQAGYWKNKAKTLEMENEKLRAWLQSHGRSPDNLLPFIRLRDCR